MKYWNEEMIYIAGVRIYISLNETPPLVADDKHSFAIILEPVYNSFILMQYRNGGWGLAKPKLYKFRISAILEALNISKRIPQAIN